MWIPLIGDAVSAVGRIFERREERAAARETAQAKLIQSREEGAQSLKLNDQELEVILARGLAGTWKDEYVTVSVVSIINLIVAGGVLAAFGVPEVLEGVSLAIQTLSDVGVDVGFITTAVVLSAIGLSVWRKA